VNPKVEKFSAEKLRDEAAITKERRKANEEREFRRSSKKFGKE
jgi:hypothetical protein